MIRLHFVVEGHTEEAFVNEVLLSHLGNFDVVCDARRVETSRKQARIFRGGGVSYERLRNDVQRWMREDDNADAYFTTMIDLYRLEDDFPKYDRSARGLGPCDRIAVLEDALAADIAHPRFIPYIQLHEFEALVLADPARLALEFAEFRGPVGNLVRLVAAFPSPELIDDEVPPSKRIAVEIPDYPGRKAFVGPRVASYIGLPVLRERCPHFDAWIRRIEGLGPEGGPR